MYMKTLASIAATILLTASILYLVLQPSASDSAHDRATPMRAVPAASAGKLASVESLVGGLETRLASDPTDGKGWLLLAKSYDHLGRGQEAREAYDRAASLGMADARFEMTLAQRTFAAEDWQ